MAYGRSGGRGSGGYGGRERSSGGGYKRDDMFLASGMFNGSGKVVCRASVTVDRLYEAIEKAEKKSAVEGKVQLVLLENTGKSSVDFFLMVAGMDDYKGKGGNGGGRGGRSYGRGGGYGGSQGSQRRGRRAEEEDDADDPEEEEDDRPRRRAAESSETEGSREKTRSRQTTEARSDKEDGEGPEKASGKWEEWD